MAEQQDAFFSEPRVVSIRGKEITVQPFLAKQLAKAARLAAPILTSLTEGAGFSVASVVGMLQHTDDLIGLVALSTGQDEEWVGNLNAAELLKLATAVVEENTDFFIRHLVPMATEAMGQFAKVAGEAGQALSLPSALSDTPPQQ